MHSGTCNGNEGLRDWKKTTTQEHSSCVVFKIQSVYFTEIITEEMLQEWAREWKIPDEHHPTYEGAQRKWYVGSFVGPAE